MSTEGGLLEFEQGQWFEHPLIRRNRLPTFARNRTPCPPPTKLQRASVYFHKTHIICTGAELVMEPNPVISLSFLDFLMSDKEISWCLHNLHIHDEQALLEALQEGTAMAISDGSYKDPFGTATWTIGDIDTISIISGRAVCPGSPDNNNAYRSKLSGLYCILIVVNKFCKFYKIAEGAIEIGCDGLSALESAFDKGDMLFKDIPSYDLVAAILRLRCESPLTWIH